MKKSAIWLCLLLAICAGTEVAAQETNHGVVATKRIIGPVPIGAREYSVVLHDLSLPHRTNNAVTTFYHTTDSFEVLDSTGKTVYQRTVRPKNDPLKVEAQGFSNVYGIYPHQLRGAGGNVLLVQWDWQPSDAAACPMDLLLGSSADSIAEYAVPFCAEIRVSNKSKEIWTLNDDSFAVLLPGEGIEVIVPIRLDYKAARIDPTECPATSTCEYRAEARFIPPKHAMSIMLYQEPNSTRAEKLQVTPGAEVRIVAARIPTVAMKNKALTNINEVVSPWLKISVNGTTGWTRDFEELAKLGLQYSN